MELRGFFEDGMAHVRLEVEGRELKALVDTGYEGFIMLPARSISELKLQEIFKTVYLTADGERHEGRVYLGHMEWFGENREIAVDSTKGDFALIGMKLLEPLRMEMEPSRDLLLLKGAGAR